MEKLQIWKLPILYLLVTGIWAESTEIYQPNCREALGMHSGLIKDESISASSAYDVPSVGPHNSRIRKEKAGGAWCPKTQIAHNVYEYLQVDLGEVKVISLVETQGRFGNGQGQEYAQQYMLEYQRNTTGTWIRYYNKFGKELFKGNSNTYIAELRKVNPPIIARRVRFVPYSRHPRTICMRVELYGCPWKDGLMSYNMRQGDMRGTELQLFDFRYDGTNYNDHLVGGLGQLTDLEEGVTNFRFDQDATGKKGYEWVGWKNDSMHSGPVKLYFNFDTVRNFSFARIHCNNMFTKGIRVFGMAKLYFSVGEEFYQEEPVVFEYMKDSLIEYARRVIIPIPHRVAKKIKMELYFSARWILISEVKFESEPVIKQVPPELPPNDRIVTEQVTKTTLSPSTVPSTPSSNTKTTTKEPLPSLNVIPKHQPKKPEDYKEERRQGFVPVEAPMEETNAVPRGAIIHPEPHDDSGMQEEHIGIIIGTLAALILLLFAVAVFIIIRKQHKKKQTSAYGTYEKQNMNNKNVDDIGRMAEVNGMLASYHMYNAIACSDGDEDTIQRLKMKQSKAESPDSLDKKDITTFKPATSPLSHKDVPISPLYVKLPPEPATFPRPASMISGGRTPPAYPPPPIPPPPHLADLLKVVDLPMRSDGTLRNSIQLVEFPRDNLVFVEKLGDGEFGEVHQCEAFLGKDRHQSKSLPVVVKALQGSSDPRAREAFLQEAEILAELKDPNIAMVIGVSTQADPIFMILEYSKHGDLHQFLKQRNFAEDVPVNDDTALTYGCQVHLAIQVASGMKYLESLNMVHRDLAARNCLVTHNFTVKIGDLGASRILYESDYHRLDGRTKLPLRWMAWESAILGKFSHKSDVWAFAVTLWEILTLARERPFSSMTHQQVITNFQRIFNNDTMQVYLAQPMSCPREIYDLMCECWNKEESIRPTFREIHMFLQRKNIGYNPAEDIYMKPWA